ncbi:hypothetical protein [Ralstonia solanacearum]|uniref:hypothetical protein n=1 Tax=Ralstonia solanacearum TaxID=305 RepID=UPI001FEFD3BA|nr:hypothetical protein [Ralstonia solanacearum]
MEPEAVIEFAAGDQRGLGGRRFHRAGALRENGKQRHQGNRHRMPVCLQVHPDQRTHRHPNVLQHREKQHETSLARFSGGHRHEPATTPSGLRAQTPQPSGRVGQTIEFRFREGLARRTRTRTTTRRA